MAGLEGTRLGAYELIQRTGAGGMAEVYSARQLTAFNREVAVKVIRAHFMENPSFRERFLREAQAITKLSHPNILPLIEFGEENGVLYLVMPLVREGTLRDLLIQRNGPLPLEEAIPLFTQLCNAVQYARDLAQTHITTTGAGIGTVEYMAPEQAIGQTDSRSDIYSLGVVFYQMLTGQVPYTGSTPFQVLMRHTSEPLPDPRQINPNLPPDVVSVLQRALAKDPQQRFQSAQELGRAIHQVGPEATTLLISDRSPQRPIDDLTARQGKSETAPISATAPTQQATGQTPGPQEAPALSGYSRGAVGAGEPAVSRIAWQSNQPPSSGGNAPVNKERKGRRSLIVALIAILLLICAVSSAGYAYFNRVGQGANGRVTQGPPTSSLATTSPIATATPTAPPPATPTFTPTATTPPVPPGQLTTSPTALGENCAVFSDFVTLSNTGGQAVSWFGNSTDANFGVGPNSGTLAPGSQVSVQNKGGDPALVPGNSFSVYFKWSGPTLSVTINCM